jgi:hypothetical protein
MLAVSNLMKDTGQPEMALLEGSTVDTNIRLERVRINFGDVRFAPITTAFCTDAAKDAKGQTLHFALKKNSNLSRRQTTMKSATDLPVRP